MDKELILWEIKSLNDYSQKKAEEILKNIGDSNLDVLSKLLLISKLPLDNKGWIQHFIDEWDDEFINDYKLEYKNHHGFGLHETWYFERERMEIVTVEKLIDSCLASLDVDIDDCFDDIENTLNSEVPIKAINDRVFKKPLRVILEKILNWCLESKCNSYTNDW